MPDILIALTGFIAGLALTVILYGFYGGMRRTFAALGNAIPWEKALRRPTFLIYRLDNLWAQLTLVRTAPWKKVYVEFNINIPLPRTAGGRKRLYDDLAKLDESARCNIPQYDLELTPGRISLGISAATTLRWAVARAGAIGELVSDLGTVCQRHDLGSIRLHVRSGGDDGVFFTRMEGNICTQSIELFDAFDVTAYTYRSFSSNTFDPLFESVIPEEEYLETLSFSKPHRVKEDISLSRMEEFIREARKVGGAGIIVRSRVRTAPGDEMFRAGVHPLRRGEEACDFVLVHNGNGWWTYVKAGCWTDEVDLFTSRDEAADYLMRLILEHLDSLGNGLSPRRGETRR